ncbi:hypothetical protein [Streptacidiphilus sp. PB12-B1b]|uniref:hypothetical protein n=1 Tax=Streptacidiphilus sp. PB12-B1b TaxID=2705012 RepID=UPI001CDC8008|nr:hypothetical protein [Streptacidiphilus sp. PB12-B1b]
MLPLDPHADHGRRAWVPCPNCDDARDCAPCAQRRTCSEHWRYLLAHSGSVLHLQCPRCTHLWDHETHFGATRGPSPTPHSPWTSTTPHHPDQP